MDTPTQLRPLQNFRDALHLLFPQRANTLLDLLDALSSNLSAQSPAELSLNPPFRRTYNSLYDGIQNFGGPAQGTPPVFTRQLLNLIGPLLPAPQRQKFWLFGIDVTPTARPFARCLTDRSFVYPPHPIGGNTPITIGHAFPVLPYLGALGVSYLNVMFYFLLSLMFSAASNSRSAAIGIPMAILFGYQFWFIGNCRGRAISGGIVNAVKCGDILRSIVR